ncbi:MAG TPA: DinB family protein [Candidatus Dormibacteraeota bacterium]|jgi:hypothetical protein|nr:DinB family protein [Candidatus Dormibacteraeota bacterium]
MTWTAPAFDEVEEPLEASERAMLEGFLEGVRSSFLIRCSGLTGEQLAERAVPPSNLSLLGLVRHITEVERNWFRRRFAGQEVPHLYTRPEVPDADFTELDPALAARDLDRLVAEQEAARRAVAHLSLDDVFLHDRFGRMSLRWLYSHMIGEYSGHIGHADLIRERVDGRTYA